MKRNYKILFCSILLCLLCACAGKEAKVKSVRVVKYNDATKMLFDRQYYMAANEYKLFSEQNQFTKAGNDSMIMSAYSYYKARKYDESLDIIHQYKNYNVESENLEYVYFLEIMNYFAKLDLSKKNLELQKQLIVLMDNIKRKFPDSQYTKYLLDRKKEIVEYIIKNELKIVDFYMNSNNILGVLQHLNNINEKYVYNNVELFGEINYRYFEVYKHLDFKDGITRHYLMLEKYCKNTRWYEYAKKNL